MTEAVLGGSLVGQPDPDEFLSAAMRWHFGRETGSPFWLERAASFDFDPLTDVKSFADLRRFPNVTNDLREVPARDLIPRGYGPDAQVAGVYESGGTTGLPKRVVLLPDWMEQSDAWVSACIDARGVPRDVDWLSLSPTGPHAVGHTIGRLARRRGGINFDIDLDPRWVKRVIAEGDRDQAASYFEHLLEQTLHVLRTQEIGILATAPPLLERLALHDELTDLIRENVKAILWGGAQMDADTRELLRREVFPDVPLHGVYGNTMILSAIYERPGTREDGSCVFDPPGPWITFSVVDSETREPVPYGERGQVLTHHLSKSFLLPNNLERDLATRLEPPDGGIGDSIADVAPVPTYDDHTVIEGAY